MDSRFLKDLINKIIQKEDTDLKAIAEKVGRDRSYLSTLINSTTKKPVTARLENAFRKHYADYFKKQTENNAQDVERPTDEDIIKNTEAQNYNQKTMYHLSKSNDKNAEANLILTKLLEVAMSKPTVDADGQSPEDTGAFVNAIAEFLTQLYAESRQILVEDAEKALYKKVKDLQKSYGQKGSIRFWDKYHKA